MTSRGSGSTEWSSYAKLVDVNSGQRIARVVLDTRLPQLDRLFDYRIAEGQEVEPGVRVKVPLRSATRTSGAFVLEVVEETEHTGTLAEISEVISSAPVMPRRLFDLARDVSDRCAGSASDVLRLAIPQRYVRVEKAWIASLSEGVGADAEAVGSPQVDGFDADTWEKLLVVDSRFSLTTAHGVVPSASGPDLPRSTQPVVALAAHALSVGKSTIIVVPDWRDITYYEQALAEVIPETNLVVLHTQQPAGERYLNYLRTLEDKPQVVLGSRHAIYAPVSHLGALVIVEDGDEAHREPLSPYPHSRDVAIVRAQRDKAAVIFASVTPSLPVRRWIDRGYVQSVGPKGTYRARVIPTALTSLGDGGAQPARLPSVAIQGAQDALKSGPVLVQVFRAGYSSGLACASCKEPGGCRECQGPLRLVATGSPPQCAWCGVAQGSWKCFECGGLKLVPRGQGIGKTVADIGRSFPTTTIIRSDGEHPRSHVGRESALVVATRGAEPLADGGYSAALLLDGPAMLSRETLSTLEDTLREWEHAISLVRSEGTVFLTDVEGAPAMVMAAGNHDHLLRQELAQRESLRLPPSVRIASLTGPAADVSRVAQAVLGVSGEADALGPVAIASGVVRTVLRFPYAGGNAVTEELRSWRNKMASGPKRGSSERVKIVIDNPHSLDTLTSE